MKIMIYRILVLVAMAISVSGCYLKIIIPEGGRIESASTYRDCSAGQTCEVLVDTINFSETFTAIADPGYKFSGWASGPGFICGQEQSNVCNVALLYNSNFGPVVHSERTGFLMPIFEALDTTSSETIPSILDADGVTVGAIYDEYYGSWADIEVYIPELYSTTMRYFFGSQSWGAIYAWRLYFTDDNCSPEETYIEVQPSQVGPGLGFVVPREELHIYEQLWLPREDVMIGSTILPGSECEDINDTIFSLNPVRWIGVDNFTRPFIRKGPPPCWAGQVEGCL
tara:strand:- start:291 stop:1139 length:849 start_codon:yes stop_codon:yes gene_type:complete